MEIFSSCTEKYCVGSETRCLRAPPFLSADSLRGCCKMEKSDSGKDCSDAAEAVDQCLEKCLPGCVLETATAYLDCSRTISPCRFDNCVTGIALDRDWIDVKGDDNDIFYEQLSNDLEGKVFSDSCESTEEKAKLVCDIGKSCCETCNPELGAVMNCVVNDMMRPWLFTRGGEFSSDEECAKLSAGTNGTEACATLLGAGDKRQLMEARRTLTETEEMAVSNETGKCMEELRWNVMMGNVTEAGEGYTNCVTIAGAKILETDDYGNDDDGSSSSSSATGGFVFAMTAAFFLALISIA